LLARNETATASSKELAANPAVAALLGVLRQEGAESFMTAASHEW